MSIDAPSSQQDASEHASPHAADAPGLDCFFASVLGSNPFLSNAVNDPSGADVDVEGIHQEQFRELVRSAEEVLRLRCHAGQVVWGEPGIGKSHLLSRLCRWAEQDQQACCIFLHNIQPSPEHLARYIVKCVVQRLVRGRAEGFHATPLYWLVTKAVQQGLEGFRTTADAPTAREALAAYVHLVDRLLVENPNAGPDARVVYLVLFRFFLGAWRGQYRDGDDGMARLAVRWLSGDVLERDEAAELALSISEDPENPAELPGTQAAESVLTALAEMAWLRGQPMILCFDQVDNLAKEQIGALTQFLHPLLDHARNLLVVVSGVQSKLLQFVEEGVILRAAWERIAQDDRGIRPGRITRSQARQILEARLEHFLDPFLSVPAVKERLQEDPLFPLASDWFQQRTGDLIDLRPRDSINWARDRWRDQQRRLRELGDDPWLRQWSDGLSGPRAVQPAAELSSNELARRIDEQTSRKLGEQIARRAMDPDTLPPDADNMAGLIESLLSPFLGEESDYPFPAIERPAKSGSRPAYDLLICAGSNEAGDSVRTGVTCLATENATSTAASLRRITNDPEPPDRVVLVIDERQPLALGEKGRAYLASLHARGPNAFQLVELTFREYAELDAMQAVIGDARSGDLEADLPGGFARRISEQEAIDSHRRQGRYGSHRLLRMLLQ